MGRILVTSVGVIAGYMICPAIGEPQRQEFAEKPVSFTTKAQRPESLD